MNMIDELRFRLQVENCAITVSSGDLGAVLQQEEGPACDAVEDFPALGKVTGSKKEKSAKVKEKRSPAASVPAVSKAVYSQVTVLLDASGWSLKMASLDALR